MVTAQMEALYKGLEPLAPSGLQISRCKEWITFQIVRAQKQRLNVVTIRNQGVSFFTEDTTLLESLSNREIKWHKLPPDKGVSRLKYRFTNLTPDMLDKYADDFRKLFEDSVKLKRHYS